MEIVVKIKELKSKKGVINKEIKIEGNILEYFAGEAVASTSELLMNKLVDNTAKPSKKEGRKS